MSPVTRRALWLWAPVVLLLAGIFFLSSLPDIPAPPGGMSDKGAHLLAYSVLGLFVARALMGGRPWHLALPTATIAVALTVAYGLSDELHQRFVPGRSPEWLDVAADAVGAVVGVGLVWAWSIVFRIKHGLR